MRALSASATRWADQRASWPSLLGGLALALALSSAEAIGWVWPKDGGLWGWALSAWEAALAPARVYLIGWHEFFHALGAWLSGGSVEGIGLRWSSGVTRSRGGFFPLIAAAGYVGSSALGAFCLRYATRRWARASLLGLSLAQAASFVWAGAWSAPMLCALGVGALACWALWRWRSSAPMAALGCLLCAEAWSDALNYVVLIPGETDAGILARHWGAEALTLPIALSFAALSAGLWALAARGLLKELRGMGRP